MSTERKEPVISSDTFELTDRVKLTWREVRELTESSEAEAPAPQAAFEPVVENTVGTRKLTEEEMKTIAAMIAPAVENALKEALYDTLEVSLQNASTRIRADIDRSVSGAVSNSIRTELSRIEIKTE